MGILDRVFAPEIATLKQRNDVQGMVKALRYRNDFAVRVAAARALGELRTEDARPDLTVCLEVEARRYRVSMTLARKTSPAQGCVLESLPPGEYLIAYNPFPVDDEQGYRDRWDGKNLDFTSVAALFTSLSSSGEAGIFLWPGPRGGAVRDQAGRVVDIRGNTGVGSKGNLPLVVEFLADRQPYTVEVQPAQASHLIVRTHACSDPR